MQDFEILRTQFEIHCKEAEKDYDEIISTIKNLRDNHINHLAQAIVDIRNQQQKDSTNIGWIIRIGGVAITVLLGINSAILINLIT